MVSVFGHSLASLPPSEGSDFRCVHPASAAVSSVHRLRTRNPTHTLSESRINSNTTQYDTHTHTHARIHRQFWVVAHWHTMARWRLSL